MKSIFKYISLLIFSGLIIPFYFLLQTGGKPLLANRISNGEANIPCQNEMPITFRIIKDMAKNLMPALKSENNL
ncbi:hypothetical protein SAMN05192574_102606 [Mucilaginibacter gossypiicola]|uniref:Uncharacterized protein n=1 Tax=Mucilaginibacter gossypiicola TaxID=551995 RepID=A0A1H8E6X7_9SPHI|nr:hypothetical protein [Mucilaginibacter gossypiicola]SEN15309.1 hypothetical protein SAMN05192574_102606 [Mucilaginibacter gossypiicola]